MTEVFPDAMQIADRFHLHQNLLSAVKDALTRKIPMEPLENQVRLEHKALESKKKRINR